MSAQWQTLVSQKIYLASHLARLSRDQASATDREAMLQGALELALRARRLMLTLVARFHQHKQADPDSLEALCAIIAGTPDADLLTSLARTPGSWWQHLDQLEMTQSEPPRQRKTAPGENVIAVSAAAGPDRSANGLLDTLAAMKAFTTDLDERHAEW